MTSYTSVGFGETASIPEDLFFLNPGYQHMVTGKRAYGYYWSKFGLAGILLTVFFVFLIGIMIPSFVNEMRLMTMETVTTEGRVVDSRVSRGKSTSYYLTYTFSVNDVDYKREESISKSEYNEHNNGDWVTITYVKEDPTSSHLGLAGLHWTAISPFLFVIGFFALMGAVFFISDLPRRRRVARLRRDGQLIFGQLMASNGVMVRRGSGKSRRIDYDVTIYYQFMNPNQKRLDRQETFVRNDLKKKDLQSRGSVAVLYASDDDYMVL